MGEHTGRTEALWVGAALWLLGASAPAAAQMMGLPPGVEARRLSIDYLSGERRESTFDPRGGVVWGYPGPSGAEALVQPWGAGGLGWDGSELWDGGAVEGRFRVSRVDLAYYAGGEQSAGATVPLEFGFANAYRQCAGEYPAGFVRYSTEVPADPSWLWFLTVDLTGAEFVLDGSRAGFGYMAFLDAAAASEPLGPTGMLFVNDQPDTAPGARPNYEVLPSGSPGAGCHEASGDPFAQMYIVLYGEPLACGDFNADGFVDFFDYGAFVGCFEGGECPRGLDADFNGDGFADFFDYGDFVRAFELGC